MTRRGAFGSMSPFGRIEERLEKLEEWTRPNCDCGPAGAPRDPTTFGEQLAAYISAMGYRTIMGPSRRRRLRLNKA